jgi:hypothetical protein
MSQREGPLVLQGRINRPLFVACRSLLIHWTEQGAARGCSENGSAIVNNNENTMSGAAVDWSEPDAKCMESLEKKGRTGDSAVQKEQ